MTVGLEGVDIAELLEEEKHALPDQGPLGVFIHHNTLHAFQHLRFHEAVQRGAELIGARPYLDLEEYREVYHAGATSMRKTWNSHSSATSARRQTTAGPLGMSRLALVRHLMLADPVTPDAAGEFFPNRHR